MTKPTLHFQRFEFKYFLPRHRVKQLVAALLPHMDWDPYIKHSQGFYRVNSLYFDSPDYACYWDKEAGVPDRKKLRLRYYGESVTSDTPIFAEIKRKQDALIVKDRVGLSSADSLGGALDRKLNELLKNDSNHEFIQELLWFKNRNALRPKVMIAYNRRALLGRRDKKFRVTIDEDIIASRAVDFSPKPFIPHRVYPNGVVFEVKYHNILPAWFHRVLQTFQLQRLAYSKYGNALRQVLPQMDDNNYQLTF